MTLTSKEAAQYVCFTLIALCAIGGIIRWSEHKTVALAAYAEAYERCVREEYHTTPWRWYAEHGEYPDCQVQDDQ